MAKLKALYFISYVIPALARLHVEHVDMALHSFKGILTAHA